MTCNKAHQKLFLLTDTKKRNYTHMHLISNIVILIAETITFVDTLKNRPFQISKQTTKGQIGNSKQRGYQLEVENSNLTSFVAWYRESCRRGDVPANSTQLQSTAQSTLRQATARSYSTFMYSYNTQFIVSWSEIAIVWRGVHHFKKKLIVDS